jgi:hypothetical protein
MTHTKDEAFSTERALKLALEALETLVNGSGFAPAGSIEKARKAITAIKQALSDATPLADSALERMAENAREPGLMPLRGGDYEPVQQSRSDVEPVACGYDETTGNCTNNPCCYTTPPAQPAPVLEGWKLVPVEPTREMWIAVNKLDDQMAAGNCDGKGCSIEQAWDCLLDAAPTPPNVATPPAAQRQWVGLTDDDVEECVKRCRSADGLAQAIEAKLKEKNL